MKKGIGLLILVGAACTTSYAQNTSPYWSIAGNNNATGTPKLGTTNSISLHLYTNNVQRMYIDSVNGRVGIGVSVPSDRLHVNSAGGENAFRAQVGGITRLLVHSNGGVAIGANTTPPPNGGLYVAGNTGLGTTTPQALLDVNGDAHINALTVGRGNGNISTNSAFGYQTLYTNTTGSNNTANGYQALHANTTGYENVATGANSLYTNTTGSYNTATGESALSSNTNGSYNTANGYETLFSNTIGSYNMATGYQALYNTTTGGYNVANGYRALYTNTTGSNNTANGVFALSSNTIGDGNTANGEGTLSSNISGYDNTANGSQALYANTYGSENTANGYLALNSNTSGSFNTATGYISLISNTTGYQNTATGQAALYSNTTGFYNTATGTQALHYNTTGYDNTATGDGALFGNSTGSENTAFGAGALSSNTTGSVNTGLGLNADVASEALINATAVGYGALADASNSVRVGNSDVTSIGGQVGWTSFSDGRYKKNIKEDVKGLTFINALRPITYTLDLKGINDHYDAIMKTRPDSVKQKIRTQIKESEAAGSKIVYNGFVAQEVEATAGKLNYNFSGVDKPATKNGLYGLRYSDFVPSLVKAVQELSKQNDSLVQRITKLEATLVSSGNSTTISSLSSSLQTVQLGSGATLEQNIPNPFFNSTIINYYLPQNNGNAAINFYSANGTVLKSVKISGNGKGALTLQTSDLPSGVYRYNLLVDGKNIDSKQMILAK